MYENFRLYSVDDSLHLARTSIPFFCAFLYRNAVDKPSVRNLSIAFAMQKFVNYDLYIAVRIIRELHTAIRSSRTLQANTS